MYKRQVYAPRQDRDATFKDVEACVEKSAWAGLNFTATDGYTGMGATEQAVLAEWARGAFRVL